MARVFACLALCNVMLLAGTAMAGVLRTGGASDRHILLAVIALIFTCFLQVLAFTYFTVTGKMIAQMIHLARLDNAKLNKVRQFKRSITRWLGLCVMIVVLVAATGGTLWRGGGGSAWHVIAGLSLLGVYFLVVYHEFAAIVMNAQFFDAVTREYNQRRGQKPSPFADHKSDLDEPVPTYMTGESSTRDGSN